MSETGSRESGGSILELERPQCARLEGGDSATAQLLGNSERKVDERDSVDSVLVANFSGLQLLQILTLPVRQS